MPRRFKPPKRASIHRRVALEVLERREVFSLALDAVDRLDMSGDRLVTPLDALIVINALNTADEKTLAERPDLRQAIPKIDVTGDGELTPSDALEIINFLNSETADATNGAANIVLPLSQIGIHSAARLANGNIRVSQSGTSVVDFDPQGNLAGQITVTLQPGQIAGGVNAISPNGRWLAGWHMPTHNYNSAVPTTWGPVGVWDTQNALAFHAIDFSGFSSQGSITQVSDTGVALVALNGVFSYRWDATHGLTKLASLADGAEDTLTGLPGATAWAMSAEGSIIVGSSGDSNGPSFATRWTDPARPERLPDLGGVGNAWSVSLDGHIIGGTVYDPQQDVNVGGRPLAAIWIDGQLSILKDAQGNLLKGEVHRVVNGVDGNPNKWIAFGWASFGRFVAFSGGNVQPVTEWLSENYSIHIADDQRIVGAFVDGRMLSLISYDYRILPSSPWHVSDQGLDDPPLPPLPPEANRLIIVALKDEDFASGPASSSSSSGDSSFLLAADEFFNELSTPQKRLRAKTASA